MIADDIELRRTRNQLEELESSLADVKRRVYPLNPARFRLISESYLSEIEMLRGRIDDYLGISTAREVSSDFVLKIQSPLLAEGIAPAQTVNRAIAGLQRGLQRLGEFLARTIYGFGENVPSHALAREFELEIIAVAPGSFEVGLRVSGAGKLEVPYESITEVIRRFNSAATHVSTRDATPEILTDLVSDLNAQLQLLQALKDIAPSRRRKELTVSLSAQALGSQPVIFNPLTRAYITSLIRSRSQHATEVGIIREVDLDKRTFKLRTAGTTLRCKFGAGSEELMTDALGRRARISGTVKIAPDGSILSFETEGLELF